MCRRPGAIKKRTFEKHREQEFQKSFANMAMVLGRVDRQYRQPLIGLDARDTHDGYDGRVGGTRIETKGREGGGCRSAGIESALSFCNNRSLFVRSAASCLPVVVNRQICRVPYDRLSRHLYLLVTNARKDPRRLAILNRCCITLRSNYYEQIREMLIVLSEIR